MTAPSTPARAAAYLVALLLAVACLVAGPLAPPAAAGGGEPFGTVTGTVRSLDRRPVANARVEIQGRARFTDATGRYTIPVVNFGTRDATVKAPCMDGVVTPVTIAGNTTKNFTLVHDRDASSHVCRTVAPTATLAPGLINLTGDDVTSPIELPFAFPFYGKARQTAFLSTNGYLTFTPRAAGTEDFRNGALTDPTTPLDGIFAFWDDLVIDGPARIRTALTGVAPNRAYTIQWKDARLLPTEERLTIDLRLHENGRIVVNTSSASTSDRALGGSATIGIRNDLTGAAAQSVLRSFDTIPVGGGTEFRTDAAPVAKAGADKTVESGAGFTLDGSASTDPDGKAGLVYKWTQLTGPTTTLKTPNLPKTEVVGVQGPVTLTYQLQVVDPFSRASLDAVVVKVKVPT